MKKYKKWIFGGFCCVTGRENVVGIISYKEVLGLENEEWRDDALAKVATFGRSVLGWWSLYELSELTQEV